VRRYCLTATAFVVRDGKTLLHKHRKLGLWLPPGGHVDEGETPDQAVLREVKEETGLDAEFVVPKRSPDPKGGVEYQHPPQMVQVEPIPGHNHHLDLIYYLRAHEGELRPGDGESADWRWHTHDELGLPHVPEEVRASGREAIALVGRNLISAVKSA
jgi:ADP-ribose pyrophosphatase YjhB (NUDIX family)